MSTQLTQGQRLRKLRREAHYTQSFVADQLNTTKQAIYKYETDVVKNIPLDKLLALASLYHCSVSWIQGLSDDSETAATSTFTQLGLDALYAEQSISFDICHEWMQLFTQLSANERETLKQFAAFLIAQHPKPQANATQNPSPEQPITK